MNRTSRMSIHIVSKNRASELYGLLCALYGSNTRAMDIVLVDDCSDIPYTNYHFIAGILNRLRLDGVGVILCRTPFSNGVCGARNYAIEHDTFGNKYTLRLDDDIFFSYDFLSKALEEIQSHTRNVAITFATPHAAFDTYKRHYNKWPSIVSEIVVKPNGDIVSIGDDCWIPGLAPNNSNNANFVTHHFRSSILYDSRIHETFRYPLNLTNVGFREEAYLSFALRKQGTVILFDPDLIYYHNQSPTGGCRDQEYAKKVQIDELTFKEYVKQTVATHPYLFTIMEEK